MKDVLLEHLARFRVASDWSRCWLWTATKTRTGYGHLRSQPWRGETTHRFFYELLVGPIAEGLELDHLCRNRACVNPLHLEPVTARINTLRGLGPSARNARKTHCARGHEFTEENTYHHVPEHRACRACRPFWRRRAA